MIASDSSRSDRQAASPAARRHAGRHARFTAAAAALLLFGSVLAVASSPAGAANTASEARLDHDSNPATASVRQFGGSDRYATALAAARYFVDVANSTGSVETAVVASGESLVDAAAAAGLAGAKDAPVLLTRRARLSSAVAKFLDDAYISTVYVVGGENAVSAKVLADLRAVPSVESVIRLSGHDRQATSVAVSYEVGAESEYCSTGQTGAVLVNADVSFADVMAVGPLAFALELPLLLTAADTLPADVAGFLIDSEVERVVVVGGTSAVSSAVVDDLASVGVDDVTRIAGANRYATAVEVLTTLADCGSVSFSTTTVALVNADAPADGVSAAPLLGQGLGADGVTPMLLVTTGALPAATRAYLASTPLRVRDALDEAVFTQLSITSIGGTAVVTPTTMAAAVAAATTSSPLTAAVTAAVGASSFTITFSAAVPADACPSGGTATPTAGSVCNLAYYTVAGYPLNAGGDTVAYDPDKRTATIQLDDDVTDDASRTKLTAGDTVAIAGGKISAVDPTDKRVVAATVFTVEKVAVDRTRPRVSIVASENAYAFAVIVEDPNLPAFTATADPKFNADFLGFIELNGEPLPAGAAVRKPYGSDYNVVCLHGMNDAEDACLAAARADADPATEPLPAKASITVRANAFEDTSGNISRTRTVRSAVNHDHPRATAADVTAPAVDCDPPPAEPSAKTCRLANWAWTDGSGGDNLRITGRAAGAAAGAAGNAWGVDWSQSLGTVANKAEVVVEVSSSRKTVKIAYDVEAMASDVVEALNAHAGFAADFVATGRSTGDPTADVKMPGLKLAKTDTLDENGYGPPSAERRKLAGGRSTVTLTLPYSDVLKSFDLDAFVAANDFLTARTTGTCNFGDVVLAVTPSTEGCVVGPIVASVISLKLTSADLSKLPTSTDSVDLPAGVAQSFRDADGSSTVGGETVDYGSSRPETQRRLRAG